MVSKKFSRSFLKVSKNDNELFMHEIKNDNAQIISSSCRILVEDFIFTDADREVTSSTFSAFATRIFFFTAFRLISD